MVNMMGCKQVDQSSEEAPGRDEKEGCTTVRQLNLVQGFMLLCLCPVRSALLLFEQHEHLLAAKMLQLCSCKDTLHGGRRVSAKICWSNFMCSEGCHQ